MHNQELGRTDLHFESSGLGKTSGAAVERKQEITVAVGKLASRYYADYLEKRLSDKEAQEEFQAVYSGFMQKVLPGIYAGVAKAVSSVDSEAAKDLEELSEKEKELEITEALKTLPPAKQFIDLAIAGIREKGLLQTAADIALSRDKALGSIFEKLEDGLEQMGGIRLQTAEIVQITQAWADALKPSRRAVINAKRAERILDNLTVQAESLGGAEVLSEGAVKAAFAAEYGTRSRFLRLHAVSDEKRDKMFSGLRGFADKFEELLVASGEEPRQMLGQLLGSSLKAVGGASLPIKALTASLMRMQADWIFGERRH